MISQSFLPCSYAIDRLLDGYSGFTVLKTLFQLLRPVRKWDSDYLVIFDHKIEVFSFQNNPKNLDPSYKKDLDFFRLF